MPAPSEMTSAVAIARGWPVVTDDRKAIRVMGGRVAIRSSLAVVKTWVDRTALPANALRTVLLDLQQRGNYVPGRNHPLKDWWDQALSDESPRTPRSGAPRHDSERGP